MCPPKQRHVVDKVAHAFRLATLHIARLNMSSELEKLSVELVGRGAHRHLAFTLPPVEHVCAQQVEANTAGKLQIEISIPPALMVDPYQLESSLPSEVELKLTGDLDLELYGSTPSHLPAQLISACRTAFNCKT